MSHVVLLSGGSGTRLWPLSNEARSKQFLKVLRDEDGEPQSMVQHVVSQLRKANPAVDILIATSSSQVTSIQAQVDGDYDIVVEPHRRDTAPAIMLAGSYLSTEKGIGDDEPVIVMPIDSYVEDGYFELVDVLEEAIRSNTADIVLLGVKPANASSQFGYIVPRNSCDPLDVSAMQVQAVESFCEKPSPEIAQGLIDRGAVWNCGVFAFRLGYLREIVARYTDAASYEETKVDYDRLPMTSFDYAVVEQAQSVAVIPYDGVWKDLGTWAALTEEMHEAEAGRVISDDIDGTHVINELNIPLVALGIQDAVIVATPDGILVSSKESSAHMKGYIERAAEGRAMYETRNWGEYRVLDHTSYADGVKSLTKHLLIKEGRQISYQRHDKRDEIWTITEGEGEIAIDGKVHGVGRGDSIDIPHGQLHAIRALRDLHVIEVQIGAVLSEDDIERFGFFWE